MARKFPHLLGFICSLFVMSCTTYQTLPSQKQPATRSIILKNLDTISEKQVGRLISWECKDFIQGGNTIVEVGYFDNPDFKEMGFILYDGSNIGVATLYRRTGLEQRWDWYPIGESYSFVISPDGNGLYYDFTSVPDGESTKAKAVYKCKQR